MMTNANMVEVSKPYEYRIVADQMDTLASKFERIVRRAKKLGVEVPSYEVVGSHVEWEVYEERVGSARREWVEGERKPVYRKDVKKRVTGACRVVNHVVLRGMKDIKLVGWSFLAVLDMELGEDAVIVRPVPGVEVPTHYRTSGNVCEHCNHRRFRKQTFVVKHENGAMKQVGSTCLSDFLGHDAAKALAQVELMACVAELFDGMDGDEYGGGASASTFDLETYLAYVVAEIRENGWTSRKEAEMKACGATADHAYTALMKAMERR